jgi:acetyl-CoA acetyltransferase
VESIKDKVAIVGVGYTPQGRIAGRTVKSFQEEAIKNAILDAGLKPSDVDGILVQPGPGTASPYQLAQDLGIQLRFGANESMMGASAGGMVFHAAAALIYGLAKAVVCVYAESGLSHEGVPPGGDMGQAFSENAAFGYLGPTIGYAISARRAMHEFKTGPETWKHIAINQRKWANLNPRAMMRDKKISFEDYYNSRMVVDPFHLFDICLISDSGRAFVVTTAERAKDCRHRPVYVMGVGQNHPSTDMVYSRNMAGPTGAKASGEEAFRMAGVTLKDIDACEIYDCFTYTVEMTLMDYGFYGRGEGEGFFAGGRTGPGGILPVNTSGGQLSEAYQMGFTPLTEAVVQLQGQAGDRQLGPKTNNKEPEIILVSGNGIVLQYHSTAILRR